MGLVVVDALVEGEGVVVVGGEGVVVVEGEGVVVVEGEGVEGEGVAEGDGAGTDDAVLVGAGEEDGDTAAPSAAESDVIVVRPIAVLHSR